MTPKTEALNSDVGDKARCFANRFACSTDIATFAQTYPLKVARNICSYDYPRGVSSDGDSSVANLLQNHGFRQYSISQMSVQGCIFRCYFLVCHRRNCTGGVLGEVRRNPSGLAVCDSKHSFPICILPYYPFNTLFILTYWGRRRARLRQAFHGSSPRTRRWP